MKLLATCVLVSLAACASSEPSSSSTALTQPPGECGSVETHIFGMYQASQGDTVTIFVARPGHHALVLSGHEAATWKVETGPDAVIDGIYAVGYHRQTIEVPGNVKVVTDSHDDTGTFACGYSWPYNGQGCDTDQLLKLAGKIVHHKATSFHGCYEATSWQVAEDLAVTSNCNAAMGEQNDFVANCDGPNSCGGPVFL